MFPPIEPEIGFERTDLVNLMGGVQYTGVSNLSIDLELAGSAFTDKPAALLYPVGTLKTGFRMGYTAMRERLVLSATGLGFGEVFQYGGLVRVDASYEIVDGVHGTLGGIVYRPGSERGFLLGLDTHDQLFVQGSWHF